MEAGADLSAYDILVVGKGALSTDGPGPDLGRVRDGLKVIVFEQTAEVLEKRLGFRIAEYGLRQVFPRVPDHPLLAGLDPENLRDWRGDGHAPAAATWSTRTSQYLRRAGRQAGAASKCRTSGAAAIAATWPRC